MLKSYQLLVSVGLLLGTTLGCGWSNVSAASQPAAATASPSDSLTYRDSLQSLVVDGMERTYLLHVPASYDGSHPVPLVFDLHGGLGNAGTQMRTTNFESLADQEGFIVVYPNGSGLLKNYLLTWNSGTCCGYSVKHNVDDVGFIRALVTHLEATYNIDPKRIYATGMSNGGMMSFRLACDAADIFAAVGPVSGTLNYPGCQPKEPVSVIEFHGTADEHVPYNGGVGDLSLAGVPFTSVRDSIDFWVNYDHCSPTPQTQSYADVRHDMYTNCDDGIAVELYTIIDGEHAWPGGKGPIALRGDQPTMSISATQTIWQFFSQHPKP